MFLLNFSSVHFTILLLLTVFNGCLLDQSSSIAHRKPSQMIKQEPPVQMKEQTQSFPHVTNAQMGWNRGLTFKNVAYDLYIPRSISLTKPNGKDSSSLPGAIAQVPVSSIKTLLVLPGWNFPRTSWVENTKLVDYAEQYGYILILPEMGKTLYESQYYPETTMKWNPIPGGQFIKFFIEQVQQRHNLLQAGQYNTLLGLSTGGRGVALIALENPNLFVAGASLSGDFSQENTPSDRLMTAVYGAYKSFSHRWKGKDNPQARVAEWKMPLYLAHGTNDNIVPESQSSLFYKALKQYHQNNVVVEYNPVKGAGHDYNFWGGQLENVFKFLSHGQQI